MPTTIEAIQAILREDDWYFFTSDNGEVLCIPFQMEEGLLHLNLFVEEEGTFVCLRSERLPIIKPDHSHAKAVYEELHSINHELRFLKLGIDPESGQIVGTGEHWVMDSILTSEQLIRLIENFVDAMSQAAERVREVLRTSRTKRERDLDTLVDQLCSSEEPPAKAAKIRKPTGK